MLLTRSGPKGSSHSSFFPCAAFFSPGPVLVQLFRYTEGLVKHWLYNTERVRLV